MARLTVEECWWTDPRRDRLAELVGGTDQADITALRAWRLAQEFWKHGRKPIPQPLFESLKNAQALLGSGLAVVSEDGVYVRGSSAYHEWAAELRTKSSAGGKKSAKRARDSKGRLLKTSKQSPSTLQVESKGIQPSGFGSVLGSDSDLEKPSGGASAEASPTQKFIGTYVQAFQKRYGVGTRPGITGKDSSRVKSFLGSVPLQRACNLIEVYLQIDDRWFETKHYDLETFLQNQNKIGVALDTGQVAGSVNWTKLFAGDEPKKALT